MSAIKKNVNKDSYQCNDMLSFDGFCRLQLEFQMIFNVINISILSSSFGKCIRWHHHRPANKQNHTTFILLDKIAFDAWQIKSIWAATMKWEISNSIASNWSIECALCPAAACVCVCCVEYNYWYNLDRGSAAATCSICKRYCVALN